MAASDTSPELVDLANAVRVSGCGGRPGVATALRRVPALDSAAGRLARGQALDASLMQSGYRASRATSIHIEARSGMSAVTAVQQGQFCARVTDPELVEMGTTASGHEVWIVLATPMILVSAGDAAAVSARVLDLANRARSEARRCGRRKFEAAVPLVMSPLLAEAAMMHAQDMAGRDVLTHTGHDGSSVAARVTRTGYAWRAVAENVAAGQPDADAVVGEWLASPEHCSNLMDPRFTEMGVAYAVNEASKAGIYWTQVFALGTDR